jgi:hypothetical protein
MFIKHTVLMALLIGSIVGMEDKIIIEKKEVPSSEQVRFKIEDATYTLTREEAHRSELIKNMSHSSKKIPLPNVTLDMWTEYISPALKKGKKYELPLHGYADEVLIKLANQSNYLNIPYLYYETTEKLIIHLRNYDTYEKLEMKICDSLAEDIQLYIAKHINSKMFLIERYSTDAQNIPCDRTVSNLLITKKSTHLEIPHPTEDIIAIATDKIKLIDTKTKSTITTLSSPSIVGNLIFSANGKAFMSTTYEEGTIYKLQTGESKSFPITSRIFLACDQTGDHFITVTESGEVSVYAIATCALEKTFKLKEREKHQLHFGRKTTYHTYSIQSIAYSSQDVLAVGFQDGSIDLYRMIDIAYKKKAKPYESVSAYDGVRDLIFNKNGTMLAAVTYKKTFVYSLRNDRISGDAARTIEHPEDSTIQVRGPVVSQPKEMAFDKDDKLWIIYSPKHGIQVWGKAPLGKSPTILQSLFVYKALKNKIIDTANLADRSLYESLNEETKIFLSTLVLKRKPIESSSSEENSSSDESLSMEE